MTPTIILAAGSRDVRDIPQGFTTSHMLTIINGRPVISWVVGDILKKTNDQIVLVCDTDDSDLITFYKKRYSKHSRLRIVLIESSPTIIHSLQAGLMFLYRDMISEDASVRVVLGDTLLMNVEYKNNDTVYISDFSYTSKTWCVLFLDEVGRIVGYYNKKTDLKESNYKAIVGRYEFSSSHLLKCSVQDAINCNGKEISTVLEIYSKIKQISAFEIDQKKWMDFGHLEGIAKAQQYLIESRDFNSFKIHPLLPEITKRSSSSEKSHQELYWYQNLPEEFKSLTPRVLRYQEFDSYNEITMEYYGYGTLAEKFVYYDLSLSFWESVLNRIVGIVELFKKHSVNQLDAYFHIKEVYENKTQKRLNDLRCQNQYWNNILDQNYININSQKYENLPLMENKISEKNELLAKSGKLSIIHGDLCFNNILFDISTAVVKLIDPRGEFGKNKFSCSGDARYDLAKLRHSFCGNYDCIIEGDYYLSEQKNHQFIFEVYKDNSLGREKVFDKVINNFGYDTEEIKYIECLLFLSMIPLHQDSFMKQKAFFLISIIKLNACLSGD